MSLIYTINTNKKRTLTNIFVFQSVSIMLKIENPSLSIKKHFLSYFLNYYKYKLYMETVHFFYKLQLNLFLFLNLISGNKNNL